MGERAFIAIDTGGFEPGARGGHLRRDGAPGRAGDRRGRRGDLRGRRRAGLAPRRPRRSPRCCAAQPRPCTSPSTRPKACSRTRAVAEFHELGLGDAAADLGGARRRRARADRPGAVEVLFPERTSPTKRRRRAIRASPIVGRPNVGKSTLVNALVGEERVIAFDQPGTTRDPIEVPFERGGRRYTLIDTAGVRRRGKTGEAGRVLLDRQDAAGDRGRQRRRPAARRARRHHRAGRARRRLHPRARPRAWCSRSTSGTPPTRSSASA